MNNSVNFELAKLLKEKGYDIDKKYNNYYIGNAYYNEDGELIECEEQSGSLSLFDGKYSAPTIAEVVMWLYEKHGIWVSVLQHTKNSKGIYFESFVNSMTFSGYNTPTKAYEAAIEYTLENLI